MTSLLLLTNKLASIVVLVLVLPSSAGADPLPPTSAPTGAPGPAADPPATAAPEAAPDHGDDLAPPKVHAKAKRDKHDKHDKALQLGGRVYVRGAFVKEGDDPSFAEQTTIQSARLEAEYRWREVRTEIEVELKSRAKLKNAFVQLRLADGTARVDVRAGNFKMPFSAIQQESIWTLPMADRGLTDNVFVNRFQLAGRAVGAALIVKADVPWRPQLRAGVFQGTDDAGNPLAATAGDRYGQNAVVRAEVSPVHGLTLGAAAESRVGELLVLPATIRRAWAAEADATLDVPLGPGRFRVWAEGVLGTSWLVGGTDPSHQRARFGAARGIAAWRFGGAAQGDRYVEPYALAGAIDPDDSFRGDVVREITGGLGYGAWDRWQIQAEVEVWRMGANAPVGIAELGVAPTDSTTALVQIGARL